MSVTGDSILDLPTDKLHKDIFRPELVVVEALVPLLPNPKDRRLPGE